MFDLGVEFATEQDDNRGDPHLIERGCRQPQAALTMC
jgi:hypothetical protein